ncbi:hypothetical protein RB195_022923 [Necator americanus]|uniref:Reverse transcriptase domain-containing protein n=1 Tax=Necator americanus TaxID=51031 RepID=A0ABR1EH61_NECAM
MKRCGPTPALTTFVAYAPTSSYEEEEVEAFYMELEKFYREDHAFYKVICGISTPNFAQEERLRNFTSGLTAYNGVNSKKALEFIMTTKTIHENSQFQKPFSLCWMWESLGGGYRNEIDHIIGIGPSPPPRKIFLHKESRESRQVQREKSQDYHQLGSLPYASRLLGRFRNGQYRRDDDSVETEAVVEALDKEGVPTQYIKVLRESYSNFTTGISPFYKNIIIDVKKGFRQEHRGCSKEDQEHRAHLFNNTVLPALTYASETWAFRKKEENAVSVIERAIERVMLGVSLFTQVRDGIRSSLLRQRSKNRGAAAFAKESKIRWVGHVMRFNDNRLTRAVSDWVPRDIKRTTGRPPTRWSDFFTKSLKEKFDALCVPRERRNHWATLARDRNKWKNYWRPLDQFEDQRESR